MSTVQFSVVGSAEDAFVTAFIPGDPTPKIASRSGNSQFDAIKALADAAIAGEYVDPDEVRSLFSLADAVAERFETLTDRVIVEGGNVLFDGAVVDNSLAKQIVRFLDEGVEDWEPLVSFMDNVMDNPNEHSREQLYDWLAKRDFTITPDGYIVAYKGVASDGDSFRSISSGNEPVYVEIEGETSRHTGRIPNPVGATISMDRNLVQHDPAVGCHVGLHVGTYEYAKGFSHGTVLEVTVNPRDVVSVPTECDWAKVRTCRYTVVNAIDEPYSTGLADPDGYYDDDEYADQPEWGEDFDFDL